jgi:hypothetical protein
MRSLSASEADDTANVGSSTDYNFQARRRAAQQLTTAAGCEDCQINRFLTALARVKVKHYSAPEPQSPKSTQQTRTCRGKGNACPAILSTELLTLR